MQEPVLPLINLLVHVLMELPQVVFSYSILINRLRLFAFFFALLVILDLLRRNLFHNLSPNKVGEVGRPLHLIAFTVQLLRLNLYA